MPEPDPPSPDPSPPPSPLDPPDSMASPTAGPSSWSLPPPRESPAGPTGEQDPPLGPLNVGPYRLLDELGEGGFGVVYLAERREPFVQRVALKVLKPGVDSAAVIARFEQERQALALMDHPNIANVLDGGLTDAKSPLGAHRPYFVMELVQGVPITKYCERNRLRLRERLELFITVCDAVQHAHMKGVIHRDLKPGNILVSEARSQSGIATPVAKVIDFGIARAVTGGLTDKTIFTERGQIIGTPEYMPPEQAAVGEVGPIDIDTRADVYSLGVVLYELLTGSLPFEPEDLRRGGLLEIVRIIREVEPPKPSTRVSDVVKAARQATAGASGSAKPPTPLPPAAAGAPPSGTSGPRTSLRITGVEPASLARQLRGDLDWIVMKAMEKARNRRYESPNSLAADVKRYLQLEPVEAGPPSAGYRIAKFIRRRKGWVAASAACLLAILVGLAAALYGLREARRERDLARSESLRANAALSVIVSAVNKADPRTNGRDITVAELFRQIVSDIELRPAADPDVDLTVRAFAGYTLSGLSSPAEAERILTGVIDQMSAAGKTSDVRYRQAVIGLALTRLTQGRAADADKLVSALLTGFDPADPGQRVLYAQALRTQANAAYKLGEITRAEEIGRRAIKATAEANGVDSIEHADALNSLGVIVAGREGGSTESLELSERALSIRVKLLGQDALPVLRGHMNLALAYSQVAGRGDDAIASARRALAIVDRRTDTPPLTAAWALHNTAIILRGQGGTREARELARKALDIRKTQAPDSPDVATTLETLALLAADDNDHAGAVELYDQELDVLARAGPNGRGALPAARTNKSVSLVALGRYTEAAELAGQALAQREKTPGTKAWLIANSQSALGSALAGLGKQEEAERLLTTAAETALTDRTLTAKTRTTIVQRLLDFLKSRDLKEKHTSFSQRLAAANGAAP